MSFPSSSYDEPLRSLIRVIQETLPVAKSFIGYSYVPRFLQSPPVEMTKSLICGIDCDEVYPNIFVGDEGSARNKEFLMAVGINHVLNTAEGSGCGQVPTYSSYYSGSGIKYLGFRLIDLPTTRLAPHFNEGVDFIDKALSSNGKVLVHCLMGLSRSTSFVLAYLVMKKGMNVEEALRTVRRQRGCRPNDGFLVQLLQLQKQMEKK